MPSEEGVFAEDFFSKIVNVNWGGGDVLWINAGIAFEVASIGAYVPTDVSLRLTNSDYRLISGIDLQQQNGKTVPTGSGLTNGAMWCYGRKRQDNTVITPAGPGFDIIDEALVGWWTPGARGIDPQAVVFADAPPEVVDFHVEAQIRNAQVIGQNVVSIVLGLANGSFYVISKIASHPGDGSPAAIETFHLATNTFVDLAKAKKATGGKYLHMTFQGGSTIPDEGTVSESISLMSFGKRQAKNGITMKQVRTFPIDADGAPNLAVSPVQPLGSFDWSVFNQTSPPIDVSLNYETLAISLGFL